MPRTRSMTKAVKRKRNDSSEEGQLHNAESNDTAEAGSSRRRTHGKKVKTNERQTREKKRPTVKKDEKDKDTGIKVLILHYPKRKEEDDDSDTSEDSEDIDDGFELGDIENTYRDKEFLIGQFVVAKADLFSKQKLTLWRVECEHVLRRFKRFKEDGMIVYKSTIKWNRRSATEMRKYVPVEVEYLEESRDNAIVALVDVSLRR